MEKAKEVMDACGKKAGKMITLPGVDIWKVGERKQTLSSFLVNRNEKQNKTNTKETETRCHCLLVKLKN